MLTVRLGRTMALGVAGAWATLLSTSAEAQAQSTIRDPEDRAPYHVELEPHLVLGPSEPPGPGTGWGYGLGLRASFEIVHHGFVGSINDSVAIGVGADFGHYDGDGTVVPGTCRRFVPGPNGTSVCVEVSQSSNGASSYWFLPVVMQWNFWLTRQWSVFVEPGLSPYVSDVRPFGVIPALYLGGRYRFSKAAALTLRLGYPTISFGVSFLL